MPSTRNLGSLPVGATQANKIRWFFFVRVDIPQPIGTKRFTDYDGGDFAVDVGDGSGSQTFSGSMPFIVGKLDQSTQNPRTVSSIKLGNSDSPPSWSTWSATLGSSGLSLRYSRVRIWKVWFDTTTGAAYANPPLLYDGLFDNHELGDPWAEFALIPNVPNSTRNSPWYVANPLCPLKYMDGGTCQAVFPMPGTTNALKFTGSTGNASIGSSAVVNRAGDFSVAFWFYTNQPLANQVTMIGNFDLLGGASKGWDVRCVGSGVSGRTGYEIAVFVGDGVGFTSANSPNTAIGRIPYGTWTHVVVVKTNLLVTFYFNGQLVGTGSLTRNQIASTQPTLIGADPGPVISTIGALSEVRYYNASISAAEAANIYNGVASALASLVGYWRLNEGSGTSLADSSGSGLTGTISGLASSVFWIFEPNGETTCAKTRKNCTDRGNQVHFGGDDFMPKPGETIYWGTTASPPSGV